MSADRDAPGVGLRSPEKDQQPQRLQRCRELVDHHATVSRLSTEGVSCQTVKAFRAPSVRSPKQCHRDLRGRKLRSDAIGVPKSLDDDMVALWSATGSSNCPEAGAEPAVDRHRPPRAECFRTAVWCEDVEEASASQALNNGAFSAPRRRICLPPVDRDHTSGCRKWVRCASRPACSSRMRA